MADRPVKGLLDTSVVIDLPGVDPEHLPGEAAISAITLAELSAVPSRRTIRSSARFGICASSGSRPSSRRAVRRRLPRRYAGVFAAVASRGRRPRRGFADLLIASVALAGGLPLFMTNADDLIVLEYLVTGRCPAEQAEREEKPTVARTTQTVEVDGRTLALSNLEKVLYPASGTTKAEVLHYYTQVHRRCSRSSPGGR